MMKEDLEKIQAEALEKIQNSDALEKLNEIRVAYLGKKGEYDHIECDSCDMSIDVEAALISAE